jgi:SAM-dependent methyltransferase
VVVGVGRYDTIGLRYARYRRPDPRIAAQIDRVLGAADLVVNVGAGSGSYETGERNYVAVEPSEVMLAQRPMWGASAVRAVAEHLPFARRSFDAATAILTVHHWSDAVAGVGELRRVTRGRVIVLCWDAEHFARTFWLVQDYLPEAIEHEKNLLTYPTLREMLAPCVVEPVLVPYDCTDGFFAAYWRRPEMYLDPDARATISSLALLDGAVVERMATRLRADLRSGAWRHRHGQLLAQDTYDAGYRLIISEPTDDGG